MGQVMSIWRPKKNTLFDAALSKVGSLSDSISNDDPKVIKNKWTRIIPDDPNSPTVMGMGDNEHLIYYPPNSTPYHHQHEETVKNVEIISGEVHDLISGKTFKAGDKFKVYSSDNIQPYTNETPAYVKVIVSKIDSIWERVCGDD